MASDSGSPLQARLELLAHPVAQFGYYQFTYFSKSWRTAVNLVIATAYAVGTMDRRGDGQAAAMTLWLQLAGQLAAAVDAGGQKFFIELMTPERENGYRLVQRALAEGYSEDWLEADDVLPVSLAADARELVRAYQAIVDEYNTPA